MILRVTLVSNMDSLKRNDNRKSNQSEHIAAIDLGSNTCRLLVARPENMNYRVVDSFSRVVRLGSGIRNAGILSEDAIVRTIEALKICADKLDKYSISKIRAVATEACRQAHNQLEFLQRVKNETGIELEIISEFEEARLALKGCTGLVNNNYKYVLGFDIGGCSTEVMWAKNDPNSSKNKVIDWISIPYGIVSLLDSCGGDSLEFYDDIRKRISQELSHIRDHALILREMEQNNVQTIGSSGTTTTIAAIYLNLTRYDRSKVDGTSLPINSLNLISDTLRNLSPRERSANSCIGPGRSEVVIGGLAILQGICDTWPITTVTVADRGVRDGILSDLLAHNNN
jgi:exopolyphosphatase/guanosine-5'-triphosphate,3'-diphosphate pyrophosphatase